MVSVLFHLVVTKCFLEVNIETGHC